MAFGVTSPARGVARGTMNGGGGRIWPAALALAAPVVIGLPFARLLLAGISGPEGLTLIPLAEALADEAVLRGLRRSLETSRMWL